MSADNLAVWKIVGGHRPPLQLFLESRPVLEYGDQKIFSHLANSPDYTCMNEFLPPDDPSRLSKPSVPPLTMTTEDGKPYTRSPEVRENIGESLCWTVALLLARYTSLLNEALVFNIRRFRGHDEHICGLL